MSTRLYV